MWNILLLEFSLEPPLSVPAPASWSLSRCCRIFCIEPPQKRKLLSSQNLKKKVKKKKVIIISSAKNWIWKIWIQEPRNWFSTQHPPPGLPIHGRWQGAMGRPSKLIIIVYHFMSNKLVSTIASFWATRAPPTPARQMFGSSSDASASEIRFTFDRRHIWSIFLLFSTFSSGAASLARDSKDPVASSHSSSWAPLGLRSRQRIPEKTMILFEEKGFSSRVSSPWEDKDWGKITAWEFPHLCPIVAQQAAHPTILGWFSEPATFCPAVLPVECV